ncbi:MAG: THUMP domain-containing class I SAM-dependent RNA methyltransferase [Spirochaeta sp.]
MNVLDSSQEFPVQLVPLPQFADLAEREAAALGVAGPRLNGSIITGYADWKTAYILAYQSRLAMRILAPLLTDRIRNRDELYASALKIQWHKLLNADVTFAVEVQGRHNAFTKLGFAALVVKDAIVDECRQKTGNRPSVDTHDPDVRIHLFLSNTGDSILSLDLGSGSLHRRGYRHADAQAPLSEVLAASILEYVGYAPKRPLLDPFCGYGTILMEAGMRLLAVPAGYYRMQHFSPLPGFGDIKTWQAVKSSALEQMDRRIEQASRTSQPYLYGRDIDNAAVQGTIEVLQQLPYTENIYDIQQQDARNLTCPVELQDRPGLLVTNPPYDERLKTPDIEQLYESFSLSAKQALPDWSIHVLTGSTAGIKSFGLRTKDRLQLYNGPISCTLLSADILAPRHGSPRHGSTGTHTELPGDV